MDTLIQIVVSGLTLGAMYALSTIGLSLVWGSLNMLRDRYGKHALPSEMRGTGARLDDYLASQRTG